MYTVLIFAVFFSLRESGTISAATNWEVCRELVLSEMTNVILNSCDHIPKGGKLELESVMVSWAYMDL